MSSDRLSYHIPRAELVGPVGISCPRCDTDLAYQLRILLETAHNAAKRPALPEAVIACPTCQRVFVAGLWLGPAALAGSEVAA